MPSVSYSLVETADFACIGFHGSAGLYWGSYSDEELASRAGRLADSTKNLKAVYIYFNNDAEAFAVSNAMTLRVYLETEEMG